MQRYLSTAEVSGICQVSRGTVHRWVQEGRLKSAKTPGGHCKILAADLVVFLKNLNWPVPETLRGLDSESSRKVLIIDDEEAFQKMMKSMFLRYFPQLKVISAYDGFEAGRLFAKHQPELVLLDLMLPGLDGFEVCRRICESSGNQPPKVLVVTGLEESQVRSKVLSLGASDCLAKPFELDVLKLKIESLLDLQKTRGVIHEN